MLSGFLVILKLILNIMERSYEFERAISCKTECQKFINWKTNTRCSRDNDEEKNKCLGQFNGSFKTYIKHYLKCFKI